MHNASIPLATYSPNLFRASKRIKWFCIIFSRLKIIILMVIFGGMIGGYPVLSDIVIVITMLSHYYFN